MTPATKRPPRKADLARLAKLLDKWQRDEDRMVSEGVEFVLEMHQKMADEWGVPLWEI